jgi:hypothetical protein
MKVVEGSDSRNYFPIRSYDEERLVIIYGIFNSSRFKAFARLTLDCLTHKNVRCPGAR